MTVLADMSAWLATGLSGRGHATPPAWAYWHARAMVVAWSLLLPSGMLVARFLKVTPRQAWPRVLDNPLWWRCHLSLQTAGVALMSLGAALAYGRGADATAIARWHHGAGWGLVGVGWLQVVAGLLRGSKGGPTSIAPRGDHYDMTLRRVAFERLHKAAGWAALPVVVATTAAGLVMLDAPRWMALLIAAWWVVFAAAFAALQRAGLCVDTYQAIWGTDPRHPGQARRPIGWRVRRHAHEPSRGEH